MVSIVSERKAAEAGFANAKSQTDAAWVAATQAKRAVTVAWTAAIVGILSAAATLASPYLSESFSSRRELRELSAARQVLVPGLAALIRRMKAEYELPPFAGAAAPSNKRKEEIPTFAYELRDLDTFSAEQDNLLSRLPVDQAILNLAEVRRAGVEYLRANYQGRIDLVKEHNLNVEVGLRLREGDRIPPLYKATIPTQATSFIRVLDVLLNFELNSKDGKALDGAPVHGSCSDQRYKKLCDMLPEKFATIQ